MRLVLGTGFFSRAETFEPRLDFLKTWMTRHASELTDFGCVLIDTAVDLDAQQKVRLDECLSKASLRHLKFNHNLGHVGDWIGRPSPKLLGWSMSWIIPAMIAYSEQKDFLYIEQDCLCFGNWLETLAKEVRDRNLKAAFGTAPFSIAACEQSLFWVRCDFIPDFISQYIAIPESDSEKLPEQKFQELLMRPDSWIATFNLKVCRSRPLPFDSTAWYAQKFSIEEMSELRARKLV